MKWVWVLLLVPMATHAKEFTEPMMKIDIAGFAKDWPSKGEGWDYKNFSFFIVEPQEDLNDVSVHIEFSTTGHAGENLASFQAGRCAVFFINSDQSTVQVFPQRNGEDLDLWMPYLNVGTEMAVVVGWEASNKKDVWTASVNMQSQEGRQSHHWENQFMRYETRRVFTEKQPKLLGTEEYPMQTVSFGTVCDHLDISELSPPMS